MATPDWLPNTNTNEESACIDGFHWLALMSQGARGEGGGGGEPLDSGAAWPTTTNERCEAQAARALLSCGRR